MQAQEGGIPCPDDLVIHLHCNLDNCENGTGKGENFNFIQHIKVKMRQNIVFEDAIFFAS